MISIVVPIYNKEIYLEKAFQSILAQTYTNFEVIVIDDGSTDKSLKTIKLFLKSYKQSTAQWRLVEQNNFGVSSTRNNGIRLSNFEYIAFLDADDWWAPDYLAKMKELIDKYPQAGIYGSSYYKVKNNHSTPAVIGVESGFKDGIINYFEVYAKTLWMPLWTGATIIKKSVFEELHGFNPQLKLGEDFDLWARVAVKYPVAFLNKPLAYYNQDVDVNARAVGVRLYEPHEHMLFTAYSPVLMANPDFIYLRERLVLYGMLPYYAAEKNLEIVQSIIGSVSWNRHELKYFVYYKLLSPTLLRCWRSLLKMASILKQYLRK
jgi:glycosyltransferase involved in cell wall biosynthesis